MEYLAKKAQKKVRRLGRVPVWSAGSRILARSLVANLLLVVIVQAEKVAKKLKANAVSGYSNDSNPFGDPNLTEK